MASPRRSPSALASAESQARSQAAAKPELFELLRRDPARWSRNQNFELYESPAALRTLRRVLWLRRLERDLLALPCGVQIEAAGEGSFSLEIELPALHLRRRVHLSSLELATLQQGVAGARLRNGGETES
jgi:hypothetical protein